MHAVFLTCISVALSKGTPLLLMFIPRPPGRLLPALGMFTLMLVVDVDGVGEDGDGNLPAIV